MKRLLALCLALSLQAPAAPASHAPKPLFRDPVYDGAADPVLVKDRASGEWAMFYTVRRANVAGLSGVAWVHGTPIGVARSSDGGNTWRYDGTAQIETQADTATPTFWAPEILDDGKRYHMFLTVVPGVFEDWRHPRHIEHLVSTDLRTWTNPVRLELGSERVIDACAYRMPDGVWRLWYNNELDHKSIYWAESTDLEKWTLRGRAVADQGGEGPKVFRWRNAYWMITDVWQGLAVYRSEDAEHWVRQRENILQAPGRGEDDQVIGGHADIVVRNDHAYVFYFTHPGRRGPDARKDGFEQRRSSIQVAELKESEGIISCDRNASTEVRLNE